jgi:glycosyltransferase involved in cell wall biosynthesis
MARILFVAPYPLSRIHIRSYGFIRQIAKKHNITAIALQAGKNDNTVIQELQDEGVITIAIQEKTFQQYFRSLRALKSQLPLQVAFGAAPALQVAISEQLYSNQFDLLHVEHIRALGALLKSPPIPVVWDAVDCVSWLFEQGARMGVTPMLRFIGQHEAQRIGIYEYEQLQRFRHVLVTSERDRQAMLKLKKRNTTMIAASEQAEITVIPHGIDQKYFQRHTDPRWPDTLIFSGKMSFHANIAGVLYLVEHIMPRIWEKRSQVRLIIAGSDPPPKVRQLARDPRIQVTGYVSDLRPYIGQAQIAVSPLPYAVGIQNKLLEAMALGTPVVANSNASAGLQAVAGRDLLVADDPEVFATSVMRLLDDQMLWYKLATSGAAYVATHHNWGPIMEQLYAVYARATGRGEFLY